MDVEHAGPPQPKVGRGRGLPRSGGPAFVDDRAPAIETDELVDLPSPPSGEVGRLAKRARRVGRIKLPSATRCYGPRARRACFRRSRLPTQWGGRPAREASPPGGDDQVAKCRTLTTSLISPPHAVGRSAGSRSEPAGWGRSSSYFTPLASDEPNTALRE